MHHNNRLINSPIIVRVVTSMRLFNWHILPELRRLSPAVRKGLDHHSLHLRRRDIRFYFYAMAMTELALVAVVMFAIYVLVPASVRLWFDERSNLEFFAMIIAAAVLGGLVGGPLVGAMVRPFRRRILHQYVREHWRDGRPPICYACSYDLRGSNGATCPECGEKITTLDELGVNNPSLTQPALPDP